MSHDHLVNKLFFQIIGTVDFSKRETLGTIVEDLRASGITKVLLVVQGDRVEAIMREVRVVAKSVHMCYRTTANHDPLWRQRSAIT